MSLLSMIAGIQNNFSKTRSISMYLVNKGMHWEMHSEVAAKTAAQAHRKK